ncbi:hypothetical protein SOM26_04100 [Sphingomonas sp. CFBP8993]|uniref:hypothetical protein n=1 Tax=Sphingomonas sp. CFBP8993 TaxID=3096526 RepID=UPI002A6B4E8C|nr:hypothetical protein [Sphingomonas sp. CFBP8993]MDY0957862.1 hypothetical protein [Sphingomonas sp. CFBP8993]
MTGMFDMNWRMSYPLSRITRITRKDKAQIGDMAYYVRLEGEETSEEISEYEHSNIMARPLQLLPAEPGIKALRAYADGGDEGIDKTPVIAWALCFDGSIRIVTPAGVDDGRMWRDGTGYVEMPDGTVHAVGELDYFSFPTVAAYFRHEMAQRKQLAAHEQSKAEYQQSKEALA